MTERCLFDWKRLERGAMGVVGFFDGLVPVGVWDGVLVVLLAVVLAEQVVVLAAVLAVAAVRVAVVHALCPGLVAATLVLP